MSSNYVQLSFFPETTEEVLTKKMQKIEKDLEKNRKSQFAKIGAVKKECDELRHLLNTLISAVCSGQQIQQEQYDFYQKIA